MNILEATNFDLHNITTPVNITQLQEMLLQADYDAEKTQFLIDGFKNGFSLGYDGPQERRSFSENLKLRVGSQEELWNKVMKEVELKRYAGPWESPPFNYFVQSPIGLVPKHEPGKTRLIFHLSYPRGESINSFTPKDICSVNYNSFDKAVRMCAKAGKSCFAAKSDLLSAFRQLPIRPSDFKWLVLKARHPITKKWFYFCNKAVPFGSSRSCALFGAFSDALAAIFEYQARIKLENDSIETDSYLDDYFFAALLAACCNQQVELFMEICSRINFPVSLEKTVWATQVIVFLGMLINTVSQTVSIPLDKRDKAVQQIQAIIHSKKVKILELQKLTGLLNFFCRAIVPGRTFTRRLYYQFKNRMSYHHVRVNKDIREDLKVWLDLLELDTSVCRPFTDFDTQIDSIKLDGASDASLNTLLGIGGYFQENWFAEKGISV